MAFLRMLSLQSSQNFTYTCINSVGWYDNVARNYNKSLKLLGDNEDEMSASQNKPNVETDGCRVSTMQQVFLVAMKYSFLT
jgi:hypothetical protein